MQELIDKVFSYEKTKEIWRSKYTSIEFIEASKLNKLLFGIELNQSKGCQCIEDLFFMLKRPKINEKIKMNMEKKFKVKKNTCIMMMGNDPLTEHSTDEQCINALRVHKGYSKYFEILPKNWEEIIDKTEKVVKEIVEVVEDAKEIIDEVSEMVHRSRGKKCK